MPELPIPDLLHESARLALDPRLIEEILGLGFLGRDTGSALDLALGELRPVDTPWRSALFAEDLFLDQLVRDAFEVVVDGRPYPTHDAYLLRVLGEVPADQETIVLRQGILRELEADQELLRRAEALYEQLFRLVSMLKAPHMGTRLDNVSFRLDALQQVQQVILTMERDFAGSMSGLRRLSEASRELQQTEEYRLLDALLDHEAHFARLRFVVRLGADGQIRNLLLEKISENRENPFHRGPWRRLVDRVRLVARGLSVSRREVVHRLIEQVFHQIAPALTPLVQVLVQLELYLASRGFRQRVESAGLGMCLAEVGGEGDLLLEGLFNPLLLEQSGGAVPCDISCGPPPAVTLLTGPNSGGKTRLLQALGLAQVMGQSGLYTTARRARLPLARGLFASLLNRQRADQTEGRLGTELLRIRLLFERLETGSVVLLDELCSGTNPSEGIEIFSMMLQLLETMRPISFITTHFLDYSRSLEQQPPISGLAFLQVEIDQSSRSTYQFVPGVAATSLAATTARRLGVTFEELSGLIAEKQAAEGS